ncbi:hypothetical protein [Dyella acidiphila]|uniref:Aspartyl protease n=1 Tax=Dyella acidiphila TaxID=2775866 RepID=A0ABR9G8W7_9GAMM|nr:hypothetical protein [Dyella acidiphila]MBE1160475.1 hypothetical protein [Dyella acidiphila]
MMGAGYLALAMALALAPVAGNTAAQVLPTRYEAGHFFATPTTRDGQTLRLLADTGGGGNLGLYWLSAKAAQRLQLATHTCVLPDGNVEVAALPSYRPGQGLPPPLSVFCAQVVLIQNQTSFDDGQLGAAYFKGRIWTFDYPGQQLIMQDSSWKPHADAHTTPMGFQKNDAGQVVASFPRITIRVDGQPLDMLLDTGASAYPTPAGARISGVATVHGEGVASYITRSTLEAWHRAHPQWRLVQQGDRLGHYEARLIEVPQLDIAGWSVGPVWFTERPDAAFHDMMSSMMDKRVEGAVGANVFSHFVMTLDYPRATAYFRCASGCKLATPPPAP